MADEYSWLVSGVVDTDNRQLTRAVPFGVGGSVRRSVLTLPAAHGTVPAGSLWWDERKVPIEWELVADTWSGLDVERAALLGLLSGPGDLVLTRRVGAVDQVATCRLESLTDAEADTAGPLTTVTAVLALTAPFFRGVVASSSSIAAASGVVVGEVDSLAGCTAPVVDAVVRVAGPAASVSATDVPSGTGLSWAGSLPVGSYLYLDAASLAGWVSTSASQWTAGGTSVSPAVDYPPAGPLQLWPVMQGVDPTDRRVKVSIDGTGRGASTAVVVRARPAYM